MLSGALTSIFRHRLKTLLFILVPALLLYARTLRYEFTSFDEQWLILNNEAALKSGSAFRDAFTQPVLGVYYRPLMQLSIVVDYRLHGIKPGGYHMTNLLLHLVTLVLLFDFLLLNKVTPPRAVAITALFGVHPLMLHTVAWIPGRNDALLFIFAIASCNCLLRWRDAATSWSAGLHLLLFGCALLSKESAVLLPVIYLLFLQGSGRRSLVLAGGWITLILLWFLAWKLVVPPGQGIMAVSGERFIATGKAFFIYLGKVLVPVQQSVVPTTGNSMLWPGLITALILVVVFIAGRLYRSRMAWTGLVIFVLILALPLWLMAARVRGEHYEHRAYLPMAGMALFLSQLRVPGKQRNISYGLVALGAVYVMMSHNRLPVYRDENAFVAAGLEESPDYPVFYQQKASMLLLSERFAECIPVFDTAISMRPDLVRLYICRGIAYYNIKQPRPAIRDLSFAIEKSPPNPYLHVNRMLAYWQAGDLRGTVHDMMALNQWKGKYEISREAAEVGKKLLDTLDRLKFRADREPSNASLNSLLSELYLEIGRTEKAELYRRRAAEADSLAEVR